MANQSPTIAIPKKTTEEVDWTTPIRNIIAQSYGESPDTYATECAALQRCRQDAVRGAGSDMTARDLLYKYFGQLELLELRFSEIRVNFCWHDAFTNKSITQTSIAYEKASILFQIASTHSAIASSQYRSDPEGLKRSFYYFRTCAGMLTYINENFLHAPSTDLSRDVVKFLINVILAQATEVFFEKCIEEKKGNGLVAKIAAQAASMYSTIGEEAKEFMGKGIFDRNWISLLQIKAKYFTSLSQFYRAMADSAASKHGESLVRYTLAETLAKEASRLATTFASTFVPNLSPTLPADAGPSIQERLKTHLALCTESRSEATRANDLIYNAILPSADALPSIDKTNVATHIPIQDVYGNPDVQKTIGADIFIRLVPLSVHESASVYSEEKAKLVRGEVENAELAEVESKSVLDGMGIRAGLVRFRAMAEGEIGAEEDIPLEVRQWKENLQEHEKRESVDTRMTELLRMKETVRKELETISRDLEIESKDCEMMRVKFGHLWEQEPSSGLTKSLRQDIKSHQEAFDAAEASDRQVEVLWNSVRDDARLLLSGNLENVFTMCTKQGAQPTDLLDLDLGDEVNDQEERSKIGGYVAEIEERLGRINKIARERNEVLKDLKEMVQGDDVSHILILNRRGGNVEPTLFATELEKFAPYQQRLAATVHHQEISLQEIKQLWTGLCNLAGKGPGAMKWNERERKKKDVIKRFSDAKDRYLEVRDGLSKGLQFYTNLSELTAGLRGNVRSFVSGRVVDRETIVAKLDRQQQPPARPPPPPSTTRSIEPSFQSMHINQPQNVPPPSWQSQPTLPPSAQYNAPPTSYPTSSTSTSPGQWLPSPPPSQYQPPPQPTAPSIPAVDPYASLGTFNLSSQPKPSVPSMPPPLLPPPPPPPQQQQFYPSGPAGFPNAASPGSPPYVYQSQQPQQPQNAPMGPGSLQPSQPLQPQYGQPPPPPQQQYTNFQYPQQYR